MFAVSLHRTMYDGRDGICGSIGSVQSYHFTKEWAFVIAGRIETEIGPCDGEFWVEVYNMETGKRVYNVAPMPMPVYVPSNEEIPF